MSDDKKPHSKPAGKSSGAAGGGSGRTRDRGNPMQKSQRSQQGRFVTRRPKMKVEGSLDALDGVFFDCGNAKKHCKDFMHNMRRIVDYVATEFVNGYEISQTLGELQEYDFSSDKPMDFDSNATKTDKQV